VSAHFMFGGSDKRLGRALQDPAGRYKARPGIIKRGRVLHYSAGRYKSRPGVIRLGRVL